MTKIIKTKFDKNNISSIRANGNYKDWPVIYILEGKNKAYIGETINFVRRMMEHLSNPVRKNMSDVYYITNERFNKSATFDIESMLIEYISADGVYELQNGNKGLRDHNYYDKDFYRQEFNSIWDKLLKENLVKNSLMDIRNSELFKMSPFKRLTEDQYSVVEAIEKVIMSSNNSNHIIHGEPGSGKTILAIFLIKYLISSEGFLNKKIGLVVPMTSLRKTCKKVFKSTKDLKANMVIGPYDVVKDEKYDLLIVDEAHRLTKRKNLSNYAAYDKVNEKLEFDTTTATQLDWIKKSCKHMVLFYDKKQTIKPTDIDEVHFNNIDANRYTLSSQFRVKAGSDYPKYIEGVLKQSCKNKCDFKEYDLLIFDDVNEMIETIKEKNIQVGLSRNVAGYCWSWVSKKDENLYDIEIDDYQYKWNSTASDWINSVNAINEIGCIHTVQGYDLNYCGVIIGNDLIMRNGFIQYNPDGYKDVNAKDLTLTSEEMLDYIVNIYKVLMTRGILGTYIYVCNRELREYLEKFINRVEDQYKYYLDSNKVDKVAESKVEYNVD